MPYLSDAANAIETDNSPLRCFLDELPDEVVILVLLFCGYTDILLFSATCKRHLDIVSGSVLLQLHIELEVNGLQIARDLAAGDVDHLTLLRRLRRYRDSWLDLDFKSPVQQHYGDEDMPLWELRGGVFVKAFSNSATRPHFGKPNSLRLFPLDVPDSSTQVDFDTTFICMFYLYGTIIRSPNLGLEEGSLAKQD
ncbi:hypothetical protein FRC10_012100 [Ceratobasidium sp. 414]|nr:hypothetical protein FRC10_012100 [Ceratobasidium sp. 414]